MTQRRLSLTMALAMTIAVMGGCNFPSREPPPSQPVAGNAVIVQEGQSIYDIARLHGVSAEELAAANGVLPPYRLTAGQVLQLPQARVHTVQSGDTLLSIARSNQVDADQLAAINGLGPPYTIYPGEVLTLPGSAPVQQFAEPADQWASQGQAPIAVASLPPPADPGAASTPGSTGNDPSGTPGSGSVTAVPLEPLEPLGPPPSADSPIEEPEGVPEGEPVPQDETVEQTEEDPPQAEPVPVAASPASEPSEPFRWPVIGEVLSDFGQKPDGSHNDGVNIAAPRGAPVRAARGGEIAYAGNELRGYGNLLLVRHPDGYITAYAHLDRILVQRGDQVEQGIPIATVGSTGAVDQPQLHFEIRRGRQPIDPDQYLADDY